MNTATAQRQHQLTLFQTKLAYLDAALTRKSWNDVHHMAMSQSMTPEKLAFDEVYYLSDGGYSRLWWDLTAGKLRVASESLQPVKTSWRNCKELIADVETEVVRFLEGVEVEVSA